MSALRVMTRTHTSDRIIKKSVRRALFGSPDPKSVQRAIDAQMVKIDSENQNAWNFDFVSGRPLAGPWVWKPADSPKSKTTQELSRKQMPRKRKLEVIEDYNDVISPVKKRHLATNEDTSSPKKTLFCDVTNITKNVSTSGSNISTGCQTLSCNLSISGLDSLISATRGVSLKPVKCTPQTRRSPRINSSSAISKCIN